MLINSIILGAGIFVTTVISGSINIFVSFKMAGRPFLRDVIFYLAAAGWTFAVMYKKDIHTAEAVGKEVFLIITNSIIMFRFNRLWNVKSCQNWWTEVSISKNFDGFWKSFFRNYAILLQKLAQRIDFIWYKIEQPIILQSQI